MVGKMYIHLHVPSQSSCFSGGWGCTGPAEYGKHVALIPSLSNAVCAPCVLVRL